MTVITEPAPGQKPLLDELPCKCDHREFKKAAFAMHGVSQRMEERLCPIAVGTVLCLSAAALVNPVNIRDDSKEEGQIAALIVADVMEKIAKGIRERASDA